MAVNIIGMVNVATQPNITSVGIQSSLQVIGQATFGNVHATGILSLGSMISNTINMNPIKIGLNALG
jgi:hypothetical protein